MSGNRLLVVEDDELSCWALRSIFTSQGWQVTIARTVAEGLAQLDPPPRCLLLDLILPDGNGEVILRTVRAKGLRIPTAVCSGTSDPGTLASIMALNPEILLAKPYDLAPVVHLCEAARMA
jgi:DNA-binding NtrC family response regulator